MNNVAESVGQKPIAERRAFGLHPNIVLTIMREQAGSLSKALAELVMNSVDAGATRIELEIDEETFTLTDNGCGFTEREQLENVFEIFGTPHKEGDAYYGRFRIGRGQIMSYAKTVWRSGPFEMRVDIDGNTPDLGYDLLTHQEPAPGCRITGTFYERNWGAVLALDDFNWGIDSSFRQMIRYVPIPVVINGRQANKLPSEEKWDYEDDVAWYKFVKNDYGVLELYNRGVYVDCMDAARYGTGGIVVSKQPLITNMARNAIVEHRCPTWREIQATILARFEMRLSKLKKLDANEAAKLIDDLLFGNNKISYETLTQIRKIRFIPDIFGELKSPDEFFAGEVYTLFDQKHTMIAERAQRQGHVTVVMPLMFSRTRVNRESAMDYFKAIRALRRRLGTGLDMGFSTRWIDFETLVDEFNDTSEILEDDQLNTEERIVLEALRELNHGQAWGCVARNATHRQIVAGKSDTAQAWTDGTSYIAIDRRQLRNIRKSGAATLILLVAHEYGHTERSAGEHAHDFAFYQRFHDYAVRGRTGKWGDYLFRRYVSGICKAGIVPSSDTGQHVRFLAGCAPKFRSRIKAKQSAIKEERA